MYNRFDKNNISQLRRELHAHMAEFFNKTGVEVEVGRIRYSDESADVTLVCKTAGSAGKPAEQLDWEAGYWQKHRGLQESDLGLEIVLNTGEKARVTGCKTRSQRCPVIVKTTSGKKYKVPVFTIVRQRG